MYLKQIRFENIACFGDLNLDFTQTSGKPCPWVVLIGENGTGKSTVLQMIALTLLGRDMVKDVAQGVDWGKFAGPHKVRGQVEVLFLATKHDKKRKHQQGGYSYRTVFNLGPKIKTGLEQPYNFAKHDYDRLHETLYDSQNLINGWFACGYGPWRNLSKSLITSRRVLATKPYRFATLFNPEYALTEVRDWLFELEFGVLKQSQAAERSKKLALHAFEKALPGIKFKEVTQDRDVIFEDNGVTVSIDQLSDGYRSTIAWIGDLVKRLIDAFPENKSLTDPLQAEGIVLIDEIDIHLHPKWQRSIVETVRRLFPNLQFIVSSHSPFIAQDMRPEDKIIVFKKQNGRVKATEDDGFVKGWRVDQILTSYLFDLETTRDMYFSAQEKEYQQLLDLQAGGRLNKTNKE
ncbi:MAG: AAA family ATPase, partial [Deltaproteobacteria bacterium]|nr:AAA family ATPase [Deltaproteobacteria bacterium]